MAYEELELGYDDIDWGNTDQQSNVTSELRLEDIDVTKLPHETSSKITLQPKKKAIRPKPAQKKTVPLKPEQMQSFKPQLPPSIGEMAAGDLQRSQFKFDQRPYKAFEAMTPQEKLKQAKERGANVIRAATPAEIERSRQLEERDKAIQTRLEGKSIFGVELPVPDLGLESLTNIREGIGHAHDIFSYQIPNVFLKGLAGTPEGMLEIERYLQQKLSLGEGPNDPMIRRFTKEAGQVIDEAFPTRERKSPIAQIVGSAAQFIIPGGVASKIGIPSRLAAGTMGAAMNVQQVAQEMDRAGVSPSRRDDAIGMAIATGLTEMAGLGAMIDKFGLRQTFTRQLLNIAEEGGQEAVQQWLNNLNASLVGGWDPNRPLSKNVVESTILGLGGGILFAGINKAVIKDRERALLRSMGMPETPVTSSQMELPFESVVTPGMAPMSVTPVDDLYGKSTLTADEQEASRSNAIEATETSLRAVEPNTGEPFQIPVPAPPLAAIIGPPKARGVSVPDVNLVKDRLYTLYTEMRHLDPLITRAAAENDTTLIDAITRRGREITRDITDHVDFIEKNGEDGETFEILPPDTPSRAAVMTVPGWLLSAITGGEDHMALGGINIGFDELNNQMGNVSIFAPSPNAAMKADRAIGDLIDQSEAAGLRSVSLIHQWQSENNRAKVIPHETFHAAQDKLANVVGALNRYLDALKRDPAMHLPETMAAPEGGWHLHTYEWARNHPVIQRVVEDPFWGQALKVGTVDVYDSVAIELPAYVMGGEGQRFDLSEDEQVEFIIDYVEHLLENHGIVALDTFETVARLRPEMVENLNQARNKYELWKQSQVEDWYSAIQSLTAPIIEEATGFPKSHWESGDPLQSILGSYEEGTKPPTDKTAAKLAGKRSDKETRAIGEALFDEREGWKTDDTWTDYWSLSEGYSYGAVQKNSDGTYSGSVNSKTIGDKFSSLSEAKNAVQRGLDMEAPSRDGLQRRGLGGLVNAIEQRIIQLNNDKGYTWLPVPMGSEGWVSTLNDALWDRQAWKDDEVLSELSDFVKEAYPVRAAEIAESTARLKEDTSQKGWEGKSSWEIEFEEKAAMEAVSGPAQRFTDVEFTNKDQKRLEKLEKNIEKYLREYGYATNSPGYPSVEEWLDQESYPVTVSELEKDHGEELAEWRELKNKKFQAKGGRRPRFNAALTEEDQSLLTDIREDLAEEKKRKALEAPPILKALVDPTTVKQGDRVISKTSRKAGKITNLRTDEEGMWAKIDFDDGQSVEQHIAELKVEPPEVRPRETNKIVPRTEVQQALFEEPVIASSQEILEQMILPGMEQTITLIRENRPENMVEFDRTMNKLLISKGIKPNSTQRPFFQVLEGLIKGKVNVGEVNKALEDNDLTMEQFMNEFKATALESENSSKQLMRTKMRWLKAMKRNPNLANAMVFTPSELFKSVMEDINNTRLGLSAWQRASNFIRMLMLSDINTAAVNAIMTAGRIPLAAAVHGYGAWMKTKADGKAKGLSLGQRIQEANQQALDAMRVAGEVLLTMNPVDIVQNLRKSGVSNAERHTHIYNELVKVFPDLEMKVRAPGIGLEAQATLTDQIDVARNLIADMRTRGARESSLIELQVAEGRLNRSLEGFGKVARGFEVALEIVLTPMRWQEWFFRKPMFISYLDLALRRRDMDLEDLVRIGELEIIPEEALTEAIDEALDFTYAYAPKADGSGFEKSAHHFIKGINELKGVAALVGTMFPRAVYNGMKFTYEYSPFGALPGIKKMLKPEFVTDPVTNEKIQTNLLTQKDYDRFAKAQIGTIMFVAAMSIIRFGLIGDEWWQVRTPKKDKNGKSIYVDIRRYQPFSTFFRLADLTTRMLTDADVIAGKKSMGDLKFGKELRETITGMKNFPGAEEYLSATVEMWNDQSDVSNVYQKASTSMGVGISFLTRPLVNLRRAVSMFDADEQKRRDLKGTGILGPLIDNVPWLRQKMLPEYVSMTERPPIHMESYPGLAFAGIRMIPAEGFAGREWRRLGFLNRTFLAPDPNPAINRKQNEVFQEIISSVGDGAENNPAYMELDDKGKAAYWERLVDKVAPVAQKIGETADPTEAVKRKFNERLSGQGIGPMQKKSLGLTNIFNPQSPPPLTLEQRQEIERVSKQAVQ